jgi:hypothetical protein
MASKKDCVSRRRMLCRINSVPLVSLRLHFPGTFPREGFFRPACRVRLFEGEVLAKWTGRTVRETGSCKKVPHVLQLSDKIGDEPNGMAGFRCLNAPPDAIHQTSGSRHSRCIHVVGGQQVQRHSASDRRNLDQAKSQDRPNEILLEGDNEGTPLATRTRSLRSGRRELYRKGDRAKRSATTTPT